MSRRGRKRKVGLEDKASCEWEKEMVLPEKLRDEMETMWELPQIYHFLQLTKDILNISHLSMYEVERMLLMPKASKQLAHIMTCLLGSPSSLKSKQQKVPPMPYEFWTNILMHKLKSWFKVYQMKKEDAVKVFDAFGIEPEFWKVFPKDMEVDGKDFQDFTFRQRVWLLKTVCDTVMHSRKSIQDEIAKQPWESQFETVLGIDRHGARYVYFPQFLFNDLRVYRHSLDNKILSSVKPPVKEIKEESKPKVVVKEECKIIPQKMRKRRKRRKSRWSNGSLPTKKVVKRKVFDFSLIEQMDSNSNSVDAFSSRSSSKMSEISCEGEKLTEDVCEENTCETKEDSPSEEVKETEKEADENSNSVDEESEAQQPKLCNSHNDNENTENVNTFNVPEESVNTNSESPSNGQSNQQESNTENKSISEKKLCNEEKIVSDEKVEAEETSDLEEKDLSEEKYALEENDESEKNNGLDGKNNLEKINSLEETNELEEKNKLDDENEVEEKTLNESSINDSNCLYDAKEEENSDGSLTRRSERIKIKLEIEDAENLADVCESEQLSSVELRDSLCRISSPENDDEPLNGYFDESFWSVQNFDELISDLSVSNFQLVADSLDGLKDLIEHITFDKTVPGFEVKKENFVRPTCEEKLLERMNVLYVSLEKVESILKESTKRARNKLQREWNSFENGLADEDATNVSNDHAWVDGNSQGWQLVAGSQDRASLSRTSTSRTCSQDATNESQSNNASADIIETGIEVKEGTEQKELSPKKEKEDETGEEKDQGKDDKSQNSETYKDQDDDESNETKRSTRVLRNRGISSYSEQLFFDEESSEEDKLAEWTDVEAVYAASRSQTGTSTPDSAAKTNDSEFEDEDAEDSDQDWILPSSRKRKRKRSSGRRLRNFHPKVQYIKVDPMQKIQEPDPLGSPESQVPPSKPVKRIPPLKIVLPKIANADKHKETEDTKLHTELDIKEEAPAVESSSNQQNYVVVTTGQPQTAGNYYVMQQNQPMIVPNNQFIQPTFISQVVQQPQVPQIQQIHSMGPNGQLYVYQASPTNNVIGNPPPQPGYMGPRVLYQPHAQLVTQPQTPTKFVQFVTNTTTASMQQAQVQQPNYPQPQQLVSQPPQQPRIINSTTLRPQQQIRYQRATNMGQRPPFPHPNGAVIRSMPLGPNVLRPGQRVTQQRGAPPRRQNVPRMPAPQNKAVSPIKKSPTKSSSLIVLSDSDDEIEMIVHEKQKTPKKSKPQMNASEETTSQVPKKTKSAIPVELLQRVSEGGISISPVKPVQPAPAPAPSPSTQLVVVVNETGSHYALALPNGSKLILTPEQVAQIRASNGGKLVL